MTCPTINDFKPTGEGRPSRGVNVEGKEGRRAEYGQNGEGGY